MYFIVSSEYATSLLTPYSRSAESEIDNSADCSGRWTRRTPPLTASALADRRRIWQACDLDQRPDLDGSNARAWNSRGNADRFVAILGMDEEIARDLFAR